MDNAAKALLMAAEILIAILILTLAVYAFVYYSDVAVTYEKSRQEQEIQKFNTQFTKYLGTEEVTIQDIVTLVHIAQDYNKEVDNGVKAANGKDDKVEIFIENNLKIYYGVGVAYKYNVKLTEKDDKDLIEYIELNTATDDTIPKIKKYKCSDIKYNEEGRVKFIKFNNI